MKGLITVCAIIMCAMTAVIGVVLFVDGLKSEIRCRKLIEMR